MAFLPSLKSGPSIPYSGSTWQAERSSVLRGIAFRLEEGKVGKEGESSQIVSFYLALNKSTWIHGKKKKTICDECQISRRNGYLLCRIELQLAIEQFFIGAVDSR